MPSRTRAAVVPESSGARPGETTCGYHVVRKLGEGPRAEVYLGFAESSTSVDEEESATAVLKICRPSAAQSATTELEALARAQHPHVVRLADAATTTDGIPCLVLERLSRGSLAHLLERRATLAAGEVVTILAPLAAALEAVHVSGVVHGAVGAAAVLFRESGAPVFARFGNATLIDQDLPPARLAEHVAGDRTAFAALTDQLLARVDDRAAAAARLADWVTQHAAADDLFASLADRLFALADPAPVAFSARPDLSAGPTRSGVRPAQAEKLDGFGRPGVSRRAPSASSSAAPGAGRRRRRTEARAMEWTRSRWQRVRAAVFGRGDEPRPVLTSLRAVRTPVWVAAASVLVAVIAAVAFVPGGADDAAAPTEVTSKGAVASTPAPVGEESPPPVDQSAEPATATQPGHADDPVVAVSALLEARDACLAELSVICLDGVDQQGSSALDDDAALIAGVRAGGELPAPMTDVQPALVERLGDTALVELGAETKPASVLMISTDAGWRIRDYLE